MDGLIVPEQYVKQGGRGLFGADPVRRAGAVRQPSLLELMSLTDWPRFVPETFGLLLVLALLRHVTDLGSPSPSGLPHAFWIPVLLVPAQYGVMGGLFAAISASVLFAATDLPTQSAIRDFYDYAASAAAQPCAWFAAALALGGLRTLHMHHQAQLSDKLENIKAAAEEFAEQLTEAANEITLLEQRIATDTATTSVILDALAAVDVSSHQTLLASFSTILHLVTGATSFVIYLREGGALIPSFGFEAGAPIACTALGLDRQLPEGSGWNQPEGETAPCSAAAIPIWVPIRIMNADVPIGFLLCTQFAAGQVPDIAIRHLQGLCRVLAKLLVVTPALLLRPVDA